MTQRIIRHQERLATNWTPEEEALAAELRARLEYKWQTGELPRRQPNDPQGITDAFQEFIKMRKEREAEEAMRSEDYDKAFNDWEADHPE